MPAAPEPPGAPAQHFRWLFHAAVIALTRQAVEALGNMSAVLDRFPFLAGYTNELAAFGLEGVNLDDAPALWQRQATDWEQGEPAFLPMRGLAAQAGLDWGDQVVLAGAGLIEEDLRFGAVFDALHGANGDQRPSASLLAPWGEASAADAPGGLARVRRLVRLGLLVVANPQAPLPGWGLRLPEGLWSVLRGDGATGLPPGVRFTAPDDLKGFGDVLLDAGLHAEISRLPDVLQQAPPGLLVVRGLPRSGRRTVVGAVAKGLGRGLLEVDLQRLAPEAPAPQISGLAAALNALPLLVADPGPGATCELPPGLWPGVAAAVVMGRAGGVRVPPGTRSIDIELPLPDGAVALSLWRQALPDAPAQRLMRLASECRLASGAILQVGAQARARAALHERAQPDASDLRAAARALDRQALDALASRVPSLERPSERPPQEVSAHSPEQAAEPAAQEEGAAEAWPWCHLVVGALTMADLLALQQRCLLRQKIGASVSPALAARLAPGVRALFKGGSGTGKSLAARLLAEALGKDLYACNLATVVSKYIGETEKRLAELFDAAEATDVVLVIEEADSLFARRSPSVRDATDRYANMDTNFLLQRMESYGGIVLLTTNLFEAIDTAFLRRFDAVIDFPAPGAADRLRLLQEHLPPQDELAVSPALLQEVAIHCALTGGQLRNVVLDAALRAQAGAGRITDKHLREAVRREYRRSGGVCVLKDAA